MSFQGRYGPILKAFQVLRYLVDHRFGGTVEDLQEEIGGRISPRTVWRYIEALKKAGFRISNGNCRGSGGKAVFRLDNRRETAELLERRSF
jgi:predicted DNA-binding transcriptional regulator YafY